jgi:membrane protein
MKPRNTAGQVSDLNRSQIARENLIRAMLKTARQLKAQIQRVKNYWLKFLWVQLIVQTLKGSGSHDATQRAAGVAYYAILSIFPLLLGLIAILGFILPSVNIQEELLKFISNNMPGVTEIFRQNIVNIVNLRGAMSALSIVILFWGASSLFSSLSLAINRAHEISNYRSFFIRKASDLGMALSTGILFLLSLGASAGLEIWRNLSGMHTDYLIIINITGRLLAFLLICLVFLLLYKLIPNTRTYWREVWPGALLGAVLFEIARTLFVFYLANFANYQLIYGSIASIIVLLIWIYYSAFVLILGAEFTFQYGRLRKPA